MFLLDWYREYLEIRAEAKAKAIENTVCLTCEALKLELAKAHDLNNELIRNITHPVKTEEKPIDIENLKPILPARHLTFGMRKQMLEAEDRRKAAILRERESENKTVTVDETKIPAASASTEVDSNLTAELEAELDVVAQERESQSGQRESA